MASEITKLEAGAWWIDNGFALLPCQPESKSLVEGFGIHRTKISSLLIAAVWWAGSSRVNLSVAAPAGAFILDFDDACLYASWVRVVGELAKTYTESTPRGGRHAFYFGNPPRGVKLRPGAELKQNCLVAPSTLSGKKYHRGVGAILCVDAVAILSSLSEPGYRTPHLLQTLQIEAAAHALRGDTGSSTVARIKEHYKPLMVLERYVPGFEVFGHGRFVLVRCPFHKGGHELKPSMWVDIERNLWGCHSCHEHGDVINLYAKLQGITDREAIRRMAEVLP